jgi:hypothetical protein
MSSRRLLSSLFLWMLFLAPVPAAAYPWMIRHSYTGCATCHGDPSGGGVLTAYGRQQDVLLATQPYQQKQQEPGPVADFGFGMVPLPYWLLSTVTYRGAILNTQATVPGPAGASVSVSDTRLLTMLLDARAQVNVGIFRAGASLGYGNSALAFPAAVTRDPNNFLLSREHWLGVSLANDSVLLRAGRMDLPFGLRNVEHTTFVRTFTQTDINADQEHGVSAYFGNDSVRTEVMLIAGNFQLLPASQRQQGYSGYVEIPVAAKTTVGLSSLMTRADSSPSTPGPAVRQAHGLFARWSPGTWVVLMAEADLFSQKALGGAPAQTGAAGLLQSDFEVIQGLHLTPALEALRNPESPLGISTSGWLTIDWFFLPHCDLRLDVVYQLTPGIFGLQQALTSLLQLHTYL